MKKLIAPDQCLSFPDYSNKHSLADGKGEFFCSKIRNIQTELNYFEVTTQDRAMVPDDPVVNDSQKLSELRQLSSEDVRRLVQRSAKKTWSLDPMPTTLLVSCLDELSPVVTCILNSSLVSGHFASKWKDAPVDPRLKNGGKFFCCFANLRPVCNLWFISKLNERATIKYMSIWWSLSYIRYWNLRIVLVIAQKLFYCS